MTDPRPSRAADAPIRALPAALCGLLLSACATGAPDHGPARDALFALDLVPVAHTAPAPPRAGQERAFMIETRFLRADGAIISAPRLVVFPRQRANVRIVDQTAVVEGVSIETVDGAEIVDPVVGVVNAGVIVDLCAAPDGDRVRLAYRAAGAELLAPLPTRTVGVGATAEPVTFQLPRVEHVEASGVRTVTPGTFARLASLAAGDGLVHVLVRVDEIGMDGGPDDPAEEPAGAAPAPAGRADGPVAAAPSLSMPMFASPESEGLDLSAWLGAEGPELDVVVEPVLLGSAVPTGQVLDAASAAAFDASAAAPLRRLAFSTRPVAGAATAVRLEESYVAGYAGEGRLQALQPEVRVLKTGVDARVGPDGRLHLAWATAPAWRVFETSSVAGPPLRVDLPELRAAQASMALQTGDWLVTFGHQADGRVLAARVRVAEAQRREASQTHAIR